MNLNKRIKRDIKYNLSFYISASMLTALAVLFIIVIFSSFDMIDEGYNGLMNRGNVEDAEFTTLRPIDAEEVVDIEDKYNVELEEIHNVDIEEEDYTLRVFAPTQKINQYELLAGKDITSEKEVLINRDFALANEIEVGDSLIIRGSHYTVVGLAARPDYLYAQKEPTDFYLDDATFGQVTMRWDAFNELEHAHSYYAIVYHEDNDIEVRQYIYDKYYSLSYISSYVNNRISMPRDIISDFEPVATTFLPIMFVMIAFIVAIVLGRMVNKEQKQIGTLVALGFRKNEIICHYAIYAMIPGVIGSFLGVLLSVIFLKPACLLFAIDYEQINFDIRMNSASLWISICMPTVLYILTSVAVVSRLLHNNTVLLLCGNVGSEKKKKSRLLADSKLSVPTKFKIRALLANKSRTAVVFAGMFIGGFLCVFGYVMMDSCDYLVHTGIDAVGSYEYQYFLNTFETAEPEQGEPVLVSKFEVPNQRTQFLLKGLAEDQQYLIMNTTSKTEIEYGKYYMTSNAAVVYGIKAGDEFTFRQIQTLKEFTVTIEDIIEDNIQCAVYTSGDNMSDLLGLSYGSYNMIISDKEVQLDPDKVYLISSKEAMKKQLEVAIDLMYDMVYIFILLGGILCIISVYLTVNMLVAENRLNISMLKVLGYRKKEINRMILNVYHILLPICYGLSVFAGIKLCETIFREMIAELNLYLKPVITIRSFIVCLMILTVSYSLSLAMLKRKVYHIDMVESLKDNRQ